MPQGWVGVTRADVANWKELTDSTKARAMWLARAAVLANDSPDYPYSDNEAARWKADEGNRKKFGLRVWFSRYLS